MSRIVQCRSIPLLSEADGRVELADQECGEGKDSVSAQNVSRPVAVWAPGLWQTTASLRVLRSYIRKRQASVHWVF